MTDKINGKTPEEIKRGLECCSVDGLSCSNCSYCVSCDADIHTLERDALAYIQQLEHSWDELFETAKQLERERDAAVADLKEHGMFCSLCMHEEKSIHEEPCVSCSKLSTANNHSNWQWRGVQEVE